MQLDRITQDALDHVRKNGDRYRRDFFSEPGPYQKKIAAIKQLRDEYHPLAEGGNFFLGLKEAKDAIEAWEAEGKRTYSMTVVEAKILLRNLLARGVDGLTLFEKDAIRRMAE